MKYLSYNPFLLSGVFVLLLVAAVVIGTMRTVQAAPAKPQSGERLLVIHDGTVEQGFLTHASTVREAFEEAGIPFDTNDLVEPGLDEELVASSYDINIYRARPVTIVDGAIRKKIMSAYRTPSQIVAHAGMELHDEDETDMNMPANIASSGAAVELTIDRATPFTLVLYGKRTKAYTQAKTVAEMLEEKDITIGESDTLSVDPGSALTKGMIVELWRNGVQTVTLEEEVPFDVEQVQDADREVGYREIKTPGVPGKRTVTYEIEMKNGKEVSRKEIQSVTLVEPKKQVEIVGAKVNLPPGSHQDWMRTAGISENDFGYVNAIFTQESGWNPAAVNPYGYYGLGQTSLSRLQGACGSGWAGDPICQIRVFNDYAISRYGSWKAAYEFKFGAPGESGAGWW